MSLDRSLFVEGTAVKCGGPGLVLRSCPGLAFFTRVFEWEEGTGTYNVDGH